MAAGEGAPPEAVGAEELFSQLRGAMGSGGGDGGGSSVRRVGVAVGAVAAVAAIAVGLSWVRPVRAADAPGAVLRGAGPSASSSSSSSSVPPTTSVAQVWPPETSIAVHGTEVVRGGDRWAVGSDGDLVAVGDWDCDGTPTPAVLRPSAGRLFLFGSWAEEAVAAVGPSAPSDAVAFEAKGCGLASVRTSSGLTVDVETRGAR